VPFDLHAGYIQAGSYGRCCATGRIKFFASGMTAVGAQICFPKIKIKIRMIILPHDR
jgi:hypothetical protein